MHIYIGTSGFAYREWRGSFYPAEITAGDMLAFYSSLFKTVEINATFYKMPSRQIMEQWSRQVPEDFCFALKAPALITHYKKLLNVEDEMLSFMKALKGLDGHLGPLLFQLPPSLAADQNLLKNFLGLLTGTQAAVEFRHPSWFTDDTYKALENAGCALCVSDREDLPEPPLIRTARFGYLRLRRDSYDQKSLKEWRERVNAQGWEEAFVFFRHEKTGQGTKLAELFQRLA